MPGLSQLQKLLQDTENLGNELNVRSASGTALPPLKIPETAANIDDSDDIVSLIPDATGGAAVAKQEITPDDLDGIDAVDSIDEPAPNVPPASAGASLADASNIVPPSDALDIDLNFDDLLSDIDIDASALSGEADDDIFAELDNLGGGAPAAATPAAPNLSQTPNAANTAPPTASDSAPSAAVDSAPSAATDTAPSAATDTAPSAATDTAPSAATDTAPSAATDTAPSAATDTAPSAATDTAPPAASDTAPSAATDTAPPTASDNAPTGDDAPPDFGDLSMPEEPAAVGGDTGDTGGVGDLGDLGDLGADLDLGDLGADLGAAAGETAAQDVTEDPFSTSDDFSFPTIDGESAGTPATAGDSLIDQLQEKIAGSEDPFADMVSELGDKNLDIPPPEEQTADTLDETPSDDTPQDTSIADSAFDMPDLPDIPADIPDAQMDIPSDTPDLGGQIDDMSDDAFTTPPGAIPMDIEPTIIDDSEQKSAPEASVEVTLTDDEYALFDKNLSSYPLNLRLAIEKTVLDEEVKNAVIKDILMRIIQKQGARELARHLTKITGEDISIPNNYEKRTVDEYSLYKQSLEYQVKNRVVPGLLIGVAMLFAAAGLFVFTRYAIYNPLKAESLYKQGYALIAENMYEQSEEKFNQALTYKVKRNWFFKYAQGYRDKRQYLRAESMYQRILGYFPHDKEGGLEWARMELNDLANYERAEEIVRRQVLDFHINDPDGLILLGDIFLEWGTELDSAKLEDARETYSTLIELKGANNESLSRMMRYFIRTDNLREVLPLKNYFHSQKKMPLGAEDLTELSGYLMEKLYGELAPNDEYLRTEISDVRDLLNQAHKAGPEIPEAAYNFGRYFLYSKSEENAMALLQESIGLFENAKIKPKRRVLRQVDAHRLIGELYLGSKNFIEAQKSFAAGIERFETGVTESALQSNKNVGLLYEDMGNIDYFVTGSYENALVNYENAVVNHNDAPPVRYKIGYIHYNRENYEEAMWSFAEAEKGLPSDGNLLFALANTYAQRADNYAAEGYYGDLLKKLDFEKERLGVLFPQVQPEHGALVDLYMRAANNAGVVTHRIAQTRGDSKKNAESIVHLSDSLRAWDALTRNQETMVRLSGANGDNLAERNIAYITNPFANYEPQIYPDIPRTLVEEDFP